MPLDPAPAPIFSADPKAAYLAGRAEIDAAVRRVLDSGRYILGPELEAFEREFAAYLGVAGAAGVANGTDALELALRALGIGPGDRVATVANSVSATAAAIVATGALPVFVEIDPATMLMDPAALGRTLASAPGIKAVIPVHLYGEPCDMGRIVALARERGVPVVEDCAQSHGATIEGRPAGAWGDLAAFSFYPTKNLPALGDAGAVAGRDPALMERVRRLRQYGWRTRYVSDGPGRNSRLDELQAAVLRVQLRGLDAANARRARLAQRYLAGLAGLPVQWPVEAPGRRHAWHQFVIRTPRRDALKAHLEKENIHCAVLYPVPLHRQPGFAGGSPDAALPQTERACAEVLSLPLHPGVTEADVDRVCAAIRAWAPS
ncbi:MAG TPA: DegT/DnrJ/EryC1/StrS family aminotransferase [Opitutaceae bacterium]|nr:DegT/DnrJ/EryC1/StrS family aminotransferase [Opitutaceae bacterium]